jgi:hypothetical protein
MSSEMVGSNPVELANVNYIQLVSPYSSQKSYFLEKLKNKWEPVESR